MHALRINLLLGVLLAVPPAMADPVEAGHLLVDEYCSDCHAVGATGDSKLAAAPRFRELHLRYDVGDLSESLVEGIVTAHPEMPEFEFDPEQAEAIVLYLKSLEPSSGTAKISP
ncbi:MAG: cytochrome c [Devosia sp.]|nr:cytochrome c [Devosia sp.]